MTALPPLDASELYRVLAESAPDAIVTIDEESIVLSINPAGERLFGHAPVARCASGLHAFGIQSRESRRQSDDQPRFAPAHSVDSISN